MQFPKYTLQLTPNGLEAIDWWLRHIIAQPMSNYQMQLVRMVIGKLWEKKVYPKTGAVQQETKVKMDEIQTLALSITFRLYDILDAPSIMHQSNLHSIFQQLPRLRTEETRFLAPTIPTDE